MGGDICVLWGTSGGQGTTLRSQIFASTMWFQGPNSDRQAWQWETLPAESSHKLQDVCSHSIKK